MEKLLFVNGHLNSGGVERALVDVLRHIDYSRYSVDLLLLEGTGEYSVELPQEVNVILQDLHNTFGSFAGSVKKCIATHDWVSFRMRLLFLLRRFFGDAMLRPAASVLLGFHCYDCAVGFRPGICSDIVAFSIKARKKVTWWHHGEFNVDQKTYEAMCDKMDRIAVVSDSCCQMIAERCPALHEKLVCVPNMLDIDAIESKIESSPYKDGHFQIVSVGRLAPEKHFENVIFAANKLLNSGIDNFEWHIVGDGADRGDLENAIAENNLAGYVVLEGNKPNPYPYMKYADLYVHPSYVESQGLTILEAMALGVPCVVTKSRGPCEFIKDGVNGILTEQNPESLAEKVLEIIKNRELYQSIRNTTRCPDQFAPKNVIKQITCLVEGSR